MVKDSLKQGEIPDTLSTYKYAIKIAWPAVVEMVLVSVIGVADVVMVSQLGTYAIAAVGITNQPRMLILAIFLAVNVGVTAIVARRKGEERQDQARLCVRQAILLNAALAIVVSILAFIFAEPLMWLAGAKVDTIGPATTFFKIIVSGMLFTGLSMSISASLRGVGNTSVTLKVNLTANIVNIIFCFLLIEGRFGFPRLEVAGAAIAMVIGNFVGFCLAIYELLKKDCYLHVSFRDQWKPVLSMIKNIFNVGGNAILEQLCLRIGFFITYRIVADLGTTDFAVHQIGTQLIIITMTVGDGIAAASTALVGMNLGKKRPDLAIIYGKIAQHMALFVSIILMIAIYFTRFQIPLLFSKDEAIILHAAKILTVLALSQPLLISQVVMAGSLRGAGDTKYVAGTMLITVTFIRPILNYILIYPAGFGLIGAWIAITIDQALRLSMLSARFLREKWIHIKV